MASSEEFGQPAESHCRHYHRYRCKKPPESLNESFLTAVIVRQRAARSGRCMGPHVVDQLRVGASKTVDRLFGVANPSAHIGQFPQSLEDGQLQGIRVLKLVHHNKIEFLAERIG